MISITMPVGDFQNEEVVRRPHGLKRYTVIHNLTIYAAFGEDRQEIRRLEGCLFLVAGADISCVPVTRAMSRDFDDMDELAQWMEEHFYEEVEAAR